MSDVQRNSDRRSDPVDVSTIIPSSSMHKSPSDIELSISSVVSYGAQYPKAIEDGNIASRFATDPSPMSSVDYVKQDIEIKQRDELLAYIIFFCLGVGSLLPWNAFITAASYYQRRFCNEAFENSFESYFSMFYTASQPLGLLFTIYYKKNFTSKSFVSIPLIIYTFIFVWTTLFVLLHKFPARLLFGITLICTFICGICSSVMNGGLFGISGILPSAQTAAIMIGQGLVGFLVSLTSLVITAANKRTDSCSNDDNTSVDDDGSSCNYNDIDYGAFIFFLLATIMLAICICLFFILLRLKFIRYFMKLHLQEDIEVAKVQNEVERNPLQTSLLTGPGEEAKAQQVVSETQVNPSTPSKDRQSSSNRQDSGQPRTASSRSSMTMPLVSHAEVFSILYTIRGPAIAVAITYMMSLSVFPSLLVQIQSVDNCTSHQRIVNDLWIPLLFVIFNLGDFLGRVSGQYWPKQSFITADNVWMFTSARILMIIALFFCKVANTQLPILFPFDAAPIILLFALGFSNGFYANLCMMFGPTLVSPQDASLAGTIMVFCLCTGLLIGACLSFLVLAIVTGKA